MQTASIQNPCCICNPAVGVRLVLALKDHYGFTSYGNTPPQKFLTATTTETTDLSGLSYSSGIPLYPNGGGITTYVMTNVFDRITGFQTITGQVGNLAPFLMPPNPVPPILPPANGVTNWTTVSSTQITTISYQSQPPLIGFATYTKTTILSNEYTLPQLDADADALCAGVNPLTIPLNYIVAVGYPGDQLGASVLLGQLGMGLPYSWPPGTGKNGMLSVSLPGGSVNGAPQPIKFVIVGSPQSSTVLIPPPNIIWPAQAVTPIALSAWVPGVFAFAGEFSWAFVKLYAYLTAQQGSALQTVYFPNYNIANAYNGYSDPHSWDGWTQKCSGVGAGSLVKISPPPIDTGNPVTACVLYPGMNCTAFP